MKMAGGGLPSQSQSLSVRQWKIFAYILLATIPCIGILTFLVNAAYIFVYEDDPVALIEQNMEPEVIPFPIGVDPLEKEITELPYVESYLVEELSGKLPEESEESLSFLRKAVARLSLMEWYQNLAAGEARILMIQPGERKEQVARNFGKILSWTTDEERTFLAEVIAEEPVSFEGKFVPGTYVVAREADPRTVARDVVARFNEQVVLRYDPAIQERVSLSDALTIASILEREAYDFTDMRFIAGVIWNRLFVDMNLQIDATLQYAKGGASKKTWWPKPVPNDKYIDSPYNTYENKGLPPTPIANPSVDAVLAALNPRETECMYYFHDDDGGFHCTPTYEEHVALLKKFYGRGK